MNLRRELRSISEVRSAKRTRSKLTINNKPTILLLSQPPKYHTPLHILPPHSLILQKLILPLSIHPQRRYKPSIDPNTLLPINRYIKRTTLIFYSPSTISQHSQTCKDTTHLKIPNSPEHPTSSQVLSVLYGDTESYHVRSAFPSSDGCM